MALNIKNSEAERLAAEVAEMAGETKTEAIKKALEERKERLALQGAPGNRIARWRKFLEEEVWPSIPPAERGRVMSKREEDEILGYGPDGV
ncbi:MAG TPA: type II toxin-antitoxin system VapB family antitoxin [Thermoanaerobaculia bacterium]|nr:type II toxin-antitoxin system VapB family antitoxin [Thermoanaerobaculia bacterium]